MAHDRQIRTDIEEGNPIFTIMQKEDIRFGILAAHILYSIERRLRTTTWYVSPSLS